MLTIEGVRRSFGGVAALGGATATVRAGSITGLIGPNGAGKTTLFDCITGFQRPDAGRIMLGDRRIDGLPPHRITRLGVARTFQLVRLLPRLSARDNLLVAAPGHPGERIGGALFGGWLAFEEACRERADHWLEFVGMGQRADVAGSQLSYGQSKLIEIARMLELEADLLLMDEPMAGINPTLRQQLLTMIRRLRDEGKTFLIIEHDIQMIMQECDEIIVMDQGRVLVQGPPDLVRDDPRVVEAYLGRGRA